MGVQEKCANRRLDSCTSALTVQISQSHASHPVCPHQWAIVVILYVRMLSLATATLGKGALQSHLLAALCETFTFELSCKLQNC